MVPTSSPMAPSDRIAVSRPEPGPLTKTSIFFMPCSMARRPAASAAICAAYGVDLREPLKPTVPADAHDITPPVGSGRGTTAWLAVREPWKPAVPADAHEITAPVGSVIVTIVLLNVLLMWASP